MKTSTISTGRNVGAVLGGLGFFIFGIVPGFYYGGFGTLMLLSKILGGPVDATLWVRAILVLGVAIGMFCSAALGIVLGSVLGTIAGTALGYVEEAAEDEKKAAKVVSS